MFGREPVIDRRDFRPAGLGKAPKNVAIQGRRARDVAAAMQKKDMPALLRTRPRNADGRDPAEWKFRSRRADGWTAHPAFMGAQLAAALGNADEGTWFSFPPFLG